MIKHFCSTAIALVAVLLLSAQERVTMSPAYPERGQTVTVTYKPAPGDKGPVTLVFTYSNLYDLPYRVPLQKKDGVWTTSFQLARYATFATFYIQSGETVIKPAPNKQYELCVYEKQKPVFNAYLYKGYSMSAQMGKSPAVADSQAVWYQRELQLHPDNYEAKMRLLTHWISKDPSVKKEALEVIAAKFNADPTNAGNLNKVTMGYLMIGENQRVDSIRRVVVQKHPTSKLAWEYYTNQVAKDKDTAEQIALLEKALTNETAENEDAFRGMHEHLFEIYAIKKDSAKAIHHANYLQGKTDDPYQPLTYKKVAQTLYKNGTALASADWYANYALKLADQWPAGIIRYFPETGYIFPYVDDSTRKATINKAKGNLYSLLGLIRRDNQLIDTALQLSLDKETVDNATAFFKQTNQADKLQALQTARMNMLAKEVARKRVKIPAPSLKHFTTLDGKPIDTSAFKNKIVLIDFWATWCMPCMEEMPYVQKLYDAYKGNPDVVFMVVNSGARNTLSDAQKWFGNKKYSFPVYYNTDPMVGDKFKFNVIPATYIIGKDGNIHFVNIGFEGPDVELKLKLQIDMVAAPAG